jgi:hypothetical protein
MYVLITNVHPQIFHAYRGQKQVQEEFKDTKGVYRIRKSKKNILKKLYTNHRMWDQQGRDL